MSRCFMVVPAHNRDDMLVWARVLELELELTRFRGHIILCVQGVANVQSTTAVTGGIPPADGRAGSSGPLTRAALA